MKIAIYGGSFNPPHYGHCNIIVSAVKTLKPDKLFVIPAYIPPHKEIEPGSPTPEQRMEMCRILFSRLLIRGDEVFCPEISDIEYKRGGKSYTSDTMDYFINEYPGAELYLVIGSDSFFDFEKWHLFRDIMKECTLCVAAREKGIAGKLEETKERYEKEYGAKVKIMPIQPLEVSSTELRNGRSTACLISHSLTEYMIENHLYKFKDYYQF